uniref:Uncharacterized protein n=1 Tax=Rhipicephalus zambeziensis TaxID=60191 RepID=A0A224YAT8_9ACAR
MSQEHKSTITLTRSKNRRSWPLTQISCHTKAYTQPRYCMQIEFLVARECTMRLIHITKAVQNPAEGNILQKPARCVSIMSRPDNFSVNYSFQE